MSNNTTDFDPYTQPFTLLMADGSTPFNLTIADLDDYAYYNTKVGINWASQLGASIIMFAVVLLITNPSKHKARLFWINIVSLVLCIIRAILQCVYWTGPWNESFAYFADDYTAVPRTAYANSIAATVMTFLLLCSVELSLFLQVQVITRAMMGNHYRHMLLLLSGIVITLTVGLRFGLMVHNCKQIVGSETDTSFNILPLASGSLIMETISIWYFCIIFVAKLGFCIHERKKKLSLKPWGPMEVICIMGGCTMVIPCEFIKYPVYT
jgi:pheromone alpha factor receptor